MSRKYWRAMVSTRGGYIRDDRWAFEVGIGEIIAYQVEVRVRGFFKAREEYIYTVSARDRIGPGSSVTISQKSPDGRSGACEVVTPGVHRYDYYILDGVEDFAAEVRRQTLETPF